MNGFKNCIFKSLSLKFTKTPQMSYLINYIYLDNLTEKNPFIIEMWNSAMKMLLKQTLALYNSKEFI